MEGGKEQAVGWCISVPTGEVGGERRRMEEKGNGRGEEDEELRRSVNREGKAQNQKGERHRELRNKT